MLHYGIDCKNSKNLDFTSSIGVITQATANPATPPLKAISDIVNASFSLQCGQVWNYVTNGPLFFIHSFIWIKTLYMKYNIKNEKKNSEKGNSTVASFSILPSLFAQMQKRESQFRLNTQPEERTFHDIVHECLLFEKFLSKNAKPLQTLLDSLSLICNNQAHFTLQCWKKKKRLSLLNFLS